MYNNHNVLDLVRLDKLEKKSITWQLNKLITLKT